MSRHSRPIWSISRHPRNSMRSQRRDGRQDFPKPTPTRTNSTGSSPILPRAKLSPARSVRRSGPRQSTR
jgi:hypothetical protein